MNHISLLLGAGFSVNRGYPTAKKINKWLVGLAPEDFMISSEGTVILKKKDTPDIYENLSYWEAKFFFISFKEFYIKHANKEFNYEEFYDFYFQLYNDEIKIKEFEIFCDDFRRQYNSISDNKNLLNRTVKILNQLIERQLDIDSIAEPVQYLKPEFPKYTGFLDCLENWGKKSTVHIHTLNHDVFFEVFNYSDWLKGELCDGFEAINTPYYSKLANGEKVGLPYFSNEYSKKFRLYKLHGSIDQVPFHIQNKGIDNYIKVKYGIRLTELFKEVIINNEQTVLNDWINYHSDFLTGTTSKILRYREPIYYDKVFTHFESNLEKSDILIVIGYSCWDSEINKIIEDKFGNQNKPLFIVEPYPTEKTYQFVKKHRAKLIEKTPEDLSLDDFT